MEVTFLKDLIDGFSHIFCCEYRSMLCRYLSESSQQDSRYCISILAELNNLKWKTRTTNMSPENQWLEDVFHTKIVPFQVSTPHTSMMFIGMVPSSHFVFS